MMPRAFTFLLLALSPLTGLAQSSAVTANAPITNFKLPVLNDEGIRSSLLRGTEARYINASQIDLVGMQYMTFIEDGSNKIDTTLMAPTASVFIVNNKVKVQGEEGVRLVRDDLDVSGTHWTYDHAQKKITLDENVRVVFRTELKGILK